MLVLLLSIFGFYGFCQNIEADTNSPINDTISAGNVQIKADYRVMELMERYKKENEGTQIAGYRVQIFSGRRQPAFDLKADFIKIFPNLQVTVIYDSPDFKTQVGNYRTKLEAEQALELIWSEFKSAFVVKTEIDLPPLVIDQE